MIATSDKPEPFPVAVEGRDGGTLLVRRLETDEAPVPVVLGEGVTDVVLVTPVRFVSINLTDEVGRKDDLLTWMRVAEVRRNGHHVFGRTLRPDEEDTGQAILLRPGDSLTFEEGAIAVSLEAIDALENRDVHGYGPVAGVLWTWMSVAPPAHEAGYRYLLAAGRRLDAANRLLAEVHELLSQEAPTVGPTVRARLWQTVASVEVAVVAYGRALDMARQLEELTGVTTVFPGDLDAQAIALRPLRNAYEHIEDRALGQVNGKPDPVAVSIFDWTALFTNHTLTYAGQSVPLHDLLQGTLRLRAFLIAAAGDLTEGVTTTRP